MKFKIILTYILLLISLTGCQAVSSEKTFSAAGQMLSDELAVFDQTMQEFMAANDISAAALAVTYRGRLVYSKGCSWSGSKDQSITQDSLFRIASISKSITAVAVFRLIEQGKLTLDDKLTDIIDLTPPAGQSPDPRLCQITVRHLLQHLAGWDRSTTFDPMFFDNRIAEELKVKLPVTTAHIIKFMAGQPLQHDPGTTNAYSNFGYCLLGRIIEKSSGLPYEQYVQTEVLKPLGITHMQLGHTSRKDLAPCEVIYEGSNGESPYGSNIENMDSHGGWIASATELVRFAASFENARSCRILTQSSYETMLALPVNISPDDYNPGDIYYACGWQVRDYGNGQRNFWHNGSLPGSYSLMLHWNSGISCAVLFNKRCDGIEKIDQILAQTVQKIQFWPNSDLFPALLSSKP